MPLTVGPHFGASFYFDPKAHTWNHNYDNPKLVRFTQLQKEFTDKFASVGSFTDSVAIHNDVITAYGKLEINGRSKTMTQRHVPGFLCALFNIESKRSFLERVLKEAQKMAALPPLGEEGITSTTGPTDLTDSEDEPIIS